jgi:hypothetical protein
MTAGARPTPPTEPPPFPVFAGVLSYLIPGLGQIAQGRVGKGVMFMVILLGMFFLGQAMGNWRNVFMPPVDENQGNPIGKALVSVYNRWHFAGQFWIGIAAWPAIWQFYSPPSAAPPGDGQPGFWHDYQRAPRNAAEEREINEFLTNSDKSPDLGWVYTVVAGMLNILVIYDAIMGPAFIFLPRPEGETGEGIASGQPASAGGAAS